MTVVVNSQQGAQDTVLGTTLAITPTGIVAGRSLLLFFGSASGATGSMTACTDTGGNTWTLPDPPKVGVSGVTNTFIATAYVHNCVAPGTITVTSNSIAGRKILLLEITGLVNTPHDAAAEDGTAAAGLTNVAPSVTLSVAGIVFAAITHNGTAEPTGVTQGWTLSNAGVPDNTAPILRSAWQEFSEGGPSGNCGFTWASSFQAGLAAIAFQTTTPAGNPTLAPHDPHGTALPFTQGAGGGAMGGAGPH